MSFFRIDYLADLAHVEKQRNITIVRLGNVIEAMGAELDVVVQLPNKKKKRLVSFSSKRTN